MPPSSRTTGFLQRPRHGGGARPSVPGFPVVLASATPSVESRVNADLGRYSLLELPERAIRCRAAGSSRPSTCGATPGARPLPVAAELKAMAKDALNARRQSLLFLNRRGYAPLTLCRVCGHRFQCAGLQSWLVEHRFRRSSSATIAATTSRCRRPARPAEHLDQPGRLRAGDRADRRGGPTFPEARVLVLSSDMAGGTRNGSRRAEDREEGGPISSSAPSSSPRGTISRR
jgi:primosomal protein N' (replication factor Y)